MLEGVRCFIARSLLRAINLSLMLVALLLPANHPARVFLLAMREPREKLAESIVPTRRERHRAPLSTATMSAFAFSLAAASLYADSLPYN